MFDYESNILPTVVVTIDTAIIVMTTISTNLVVPLLPTRPTFRSYKHPQNASFITNGLDHQTRLSCQQELEIAIRYRRIASGHGIIIVT